MDFIFTDLGNVIICLIALVIGAAWFIYSYNLAIKNEDLEQRLHDVRYCLIKGDYKIALELTDIEYQYETEQPRVLYLCNRKNCKICSDDCKHTSNILHAVNFEKLGNSYFEKENE